MQLGSWAAIVYAIKKKQFFMVLDEVWHTNLFEWFAPSLHARFCHWAVLRYLDMEEK